jgi:hypothetical protein
MPALSPPWKWIWDAEPTDGQDCYIRILAPSNKPIACTFDKDDDNFYYPVPGYVSYVPRIIVVQWRPCTL